MPSSTKRSPRAAPCPRGGLPAALLAAVACLAVPLPAGAQVAGAGQPARLRGVVALDADFGFTNLVTLVFADGSSRSIKANQGVAFAAGVSFPTTGDGSLETQATIAVKYSSVEASNGSVRWLSFPVEVIEVYDISGFRLGGGLALHLAPSVEGSGVASNIDMKFDPAIGLVLQAEYVFGQRGLASGFSVGARYSWARFQGSGVSAEGSALGLLLGYYF